MKVETHSIVGAGSEPAPTAGVLTMAAVTAAVAVITTATTVATSFLQ